MSWHLFARAGERPVARVAAMDWRAERLPGGARTLAALACVFALLLMSRDPRVVTRAELWGDDGWSWYPDAYNHGLASLLLPVGGYLNTLQRLGGLVGQLVPLRWAPTLFAALALAVQILPPLFFVSARMANAVPSAGYRLLIALVYLMLPNMIEAHANLTNSMWHLATLALLVVMAVPAAGLAGRGFDLGVLTVSGLSGPFCAMLSPIAMLRFWHGRSPDSGRKLSIVLATVLVQAAVYLNSPPGARSAAPLGAGPRMLARIVATQVLLGAEFGYNAIARLPGAPFWQDNAPALAICGGALGLTAVALLRGGWPLRGLCLFASLLLCAVLLKPSMSTTEPQWRLMTIPPMGNRYFMLPMVAWICVLFTLAADRSRLLRGIGVTLLLIVLGWGIPQDWKYMDFPRTDFVARARAFAEAPPGTTMSFPQLPPGTAPMWLVKR